MLLAVAAQAQIKMHSNGRITFQTLENTNSKGVSISPAPICNVDINGTTFFHKGVNFTYNSGAYVWMHCALASNDHAAAWVVSPDWTTPNFFVYGKGDAYAKHHYTITSSSATRTSNEEDSEPIIGSKALEVISGLNGFYFARKNWKSPTWRTTKTLPQMPLKPCTLISESVPLGLRAPILWKLFPKASAPTHKTVSALAIPLL